MEIITINKQFQPIETAIKTLSRVKCWRKCLKCNNLWHKVKTAFVHRVVFKEGRKRITKYVCDNCIESLNQDNPIKNEC